MKNQFNHRNYVKKILYILHILLIEFDRFVRNSSAGELGTTRSNMNRTGKTTAAQGIEKKYDEYKEFNDRETEAHICAAFMEMSDMSTMDCK